MFAEFKAAGGAITGGVKPVLKNVKVRPTEDDFGNKLKAWIADKGLRLFSDRVPDRNAVVTIIPIKGRLDDPDVQLWPTVLGVIRNAFVEGISSGFTHLPPPTADKPAGEVRAGQERAQEGRGSARGPAGARRDEKPGNKVRRRMRAAILRRRDGAGRRLRAHQDHRRRHSKKEEAEDEAESQAAPRSRRREAERAELRPGEPEAVPGRHRAGGVARARRRGKDSREAGRGRLPGRTTRRIRPTPRCAKACGASSARRTCRRQASRTTRR